MLQLDTPGPTKIFLRSSLLWPLMLAFMTIALSVWQHYGMNREFRIFPNPTVHYYAVSDQSSGGSSEALAYMEADTLWLECNIKAQYQWPYCQLDFSFASRYRNGLEGDLYDRIVMKLSHDAPKPTETLRVFVRGYHEAFSQEGQYNTLMPNQIEYQPNRYPDGLSLELDHFMAATWWLSEMELPIHLQKPTFTRIPLIQISTGSYVTEGPHRIGVQEISLVGKWLHADALYSTLLALWVLTTFYWSLRHAWRLRQVLAVETNNRLALEQLTSFLELSNQQLENQAFHDDLTGLRNRAGLRDILYKTARQARANQQPLCLMFMDIDHFKSINDTFGHAVGDEVLKKFARVVRDNVRNDDAFVRWGGEEFLLLCPNTDLEQACGLAEKLRSCIEHESWPHRQTLTCSFGVASHSGSDPRALIEQADRALYRAKELGRNQVAIANTAVDHPLVSQTSC